MPRLQALRPDHAAVVLAFESANRTYFAGFISDRGDAYFDEFGERYDELLARRESRGDAYYVLLDDDGSVLGRFNLYDIEDGTAEVGYRVAERAAGRGVATAGVQELCRLAAVEHGVRRLRARTTHENVASQRVLANAGFVAAGEADVAGRPGIWFEREIAARADDIRPERLDSALEQRVLTLWAGELGVEAGLLDRDGLVVAVDHRDFAAQRRATIRTARGTLLLAAPTEERAAAADPAGYCSDVAARAHGTGLLHYRVGAPSGDRDERVRVLGPTDRPLLLALQQAAGADETEESDVDVEHPLAVGIAEAGRLLAVASLLDEGASAVDVGVLVDPAERGRGLGAVVVRDIAERAARADQLIQYRCNLENEASARLARTCGFMLWGVLTIATQPG